MSKVLSLKLQDNVFRETEEILRKSRKARNAYFNEAIDLYNKLQKRKLLKHQLARESALVAADSIEVLKAFERLEDELGE
jgi:predicted transcriptional regulator